ncbi:MAG: dTDP-4-dehydrorhamnose reductase [Desulfobacterales bacterium]
MSERLEIVELMNILITGSHGQLGRELWQEAQARGHDVKAPTHHQMDITNVKAVRNFTDRHQPVCVINAAAYTQVDKAEIEESFAFAVNKTGCTNLAQVCAEREIPLFHISTDYVFDGQKKAPYLESDPVSPIGVYGLSKVAGETEIRLNLRKHIILRTSWLYGVYGQNFVKTMLKLSETKENIRVVSDQYGSPTSAVDLAIAILSIAEQWHQHSSVTWGTYHYCGQGIVSWHEFAEKIIELARRYGDVKTSRVESITTADFPTKAKRPAFSALDCHLIRTNFGIKPKPWRESLTFMIRKLYELKDAADFTPLDDSLR